MSLLRQILPLLTAALLAACQGRSSGTTARNRCCATLHGIAELKAAFNADADKPRVLLLSPT